MASGREGKVKRWSAAWLLAIAFHSAIVGVIAWHLLPEHRISVSGMVPAPSERLELRPAQAVVPAVFFASKPEHLNPEAARLYRVEEDGSRTLISTSQLHSKRNYAIQFDVVSQPGNYEIVIDDGAEGIVTDPDMFDGEFSGKFPSGDGKPGGIFRAQFKIEAKVEELMTATMYDPQKPMENEELIARQLEKPKEAQDVMKTTTPKPEETSKRRSKQPSPAPENPNVNQNVGPVETTAEPETEESAPVVLTPADLRPSVLNFAPELLYESQRVADLNFAERDINKFVESGEISNKRRDAAYHPQGPVIGVGKQGNSVSHKKEVAEYLALMHNNIHKLWAHDYLLRLDTVYREPGSRINDPDLEAVMEITLDSMGKVVDVRVVRSSGIMDYDSEAIHVSWHSSPQVAIPDEMRSPDGKAYIHWTYWRDGRMCGVFGVKVFINKPTSREALDFSLKAVNAHEKKLGMKPSVVSIPGGSMIRSNEPDANASGNEVPAKPSDQTGAERGMERINPLDD